MLLFNYATVFCACIMVLAVLAYFGILYIMEGIERMTTKEALERLKQPFNATPDTDSYFDAKEVAMKSLEKDLSIVKELEKIKAEINEYRIYCHNADDPMLCSLCVDNMFEGIYKIINEHIKENKQ